MPWNRHIFTADDAPSLTSLLNAEFDAAMEASGSGGGGLIPGVTGNGRLATSEAQAANSTQFLPPTPALGITLPAGLLWIQDGAAFVVEDDTIITGLPAGFEGYLALHAEYDAQADYIEWSFSTTETRGLPGSGTLAYIETDSDSVIVLDASDEESDVILSAPVYQARQRNIEARLAAIESGTSGGEGGEGGGPVYAGLAPWLPLPGDTRQTSIAVNALIDARLATLADQLSGGAVRENPDFRAIFEEIGAQGIGLAEVHREAVYRSRSTTIVLDVVNDGSGGSPDDLNEGTAVIDHETATIGPA